MRACSDKEERAQEPATDDLRASPVAVISSSSPASQRPGPCPRRDLGVTASSMSHFNRGMIAVRFSRELVRSGCEDLAKDTKSLPLPEFQRSEFVGLVAA